MAEEQDRSQKTEDPSAKRLQDALERGDVVKSQDVVNWTVLAVAAALMAFYGPYAAGTLARGLSTFLAAPHAIILDTATMGILLRDVGWLVLSALGLPFGFLIVAGIIGNLAQHPLVFSAEKLQPKLEKLSLIKGFKRIFGMDAIANFAKGLMKVAAVGLTAAFVLWPERRFLDALMTLDPAALLPHALAIAIRLFIAVLAAYAIIAALDYAYQRYQRFERLRMSKQELKEEFKQSEGDPHVRAKIRQVRQERSRRRMMAAVPTATAIITNPTHYAVAIRYESGKMAAPVCVAKGVDAVAMRIRDVAKEHGVPIIENPPLARTLYAAVDVDEAIKPEHYKAVAQIIGYVMRLRRGPLPVRR